MTKQQQQKSYNNATMQEMLQLTVTFIPHGHGYHGYMSWAQLEGLQQIPSEHMGSNCFSFLKSIISLTPGKEAEINKRAGVVKLQSDEKFPKVMAL